MKPRADGISRAQKSKFCHEGPNWVLIAGGALLSTLSFQFGYKLKQVLDTRQLDNASNGLKGTAKSANKRKSGTCTSHSNLYSFAQDEGGGCNFHSVPVLESNKENGVMWASSPDCLELPPKPFHHSNSSDSPCLSESGSDIFTKQEVIRKLRQQLKRRDEMILEMQDQITSLQNSLSVQLTRSTHLQSQLDSANRDLFESEQEIQRLRKAIADHCVVDTSPCEKPMAVNNWATRQNGHINGFIVGVSDVEVLDKGSGGDGERIEMLKKEVVELKEVIEGKEYLLQSYKEQKAELYSTVKELQQRLASQVPNIL
ncbi:PREDICTED: uncharacterized protein LOC104607162 isoform X4 [Nelumbo nucifera]|uniref:Uncharacterized protein LOC104607162 isoform X4 n=1 Tax=Nelumbo nucifera TaxID=4432 RepID=A0A1U8AWM3_NELNU|nr:PREDICTED: uncharacterized protein LOC104607162 isoform X4 [Nelumbo nucifera]